MPGADEIPLYGHVNPPLTDEQYEAIRQIPLCLEREVEAGM
jgi:hypothetical protein